jgi:lysophospholipase L1-like esterase
VNPDSGLQDEAGDPRGGEVRRRRHRRFKAGILAATVLAGSLPILATGWGHRGSRRLAVEARGVLLRESAQEHRLAVARVILHNLSDQASPSLRRLLDLSGLSPEAVLVVPANLHQALWLSPRVFTTDARRSYRLLPSTRSFWARVPEFGYLELPDEPEVREALKPAGASAVAGSEQTTNSWGCRGAEPDPSAPLRVLVLGDSFMQGLLIGDAQTPPARLADRLREATGAAVSVVNTGHLGYSPEQYFEAWTAYRARLRPNAVVISLYSNDFESERPAFLDSARWIARIQSACEAVGITCLVVPVPEHAEIEGTAHQPWYPARIRQAVPEADARHWFNPESRFLDAELRLGERGGFSPLYNGPLNDGHLSARGAEVWARAVADRLVLLLSHPQRRHRARDGASTEREKDQEPISSQSKQLIDS